VIQANSNNKCDNRASAGRKGKDSKLENPMRRRVNKLSAVKICPLVLIQITPLGVSFLKDHPNGEICCRQ
jgi:hypothetical protein